MTDEEDLTASDSISPSFPSLPSKQCQLTVTKIGQLSFQKSEQVYNISLVLVCVLCHLFILFPQSFNTVSEDNPVARRSVIEMAKIYKKEENRPLSNYQKAINNTAGEIALRDPSLLARCGDMLNLAREEVQQKGYVYVKGKSRSKRLMSPPTQAPRPTRQKVSAEVRQRRISALEDDLTSITQLLHFKNKRLQQAENIRNYKLCEEISQEIQFVTKQKSEVSQELCLFREKERKSRWYQQKKKRLSGSTSNISVASDDSEFPPSSPGSSRSFCEPTHTSIVSDGVFTDSESDEQSSCIDLGFQNCPPVEQQ